VKIAELVYGWRASKGGSQIGKGAMEAAIMDVDSANAVWESFWPGESRPELGAWLQNRCSDPGRCTILGGAAESAKSRDFNSGSP